MRTALLVAAEQFELKWMPERAGDVRLVRTANGPGPALAEQAMDMVSGPVDLVVSVGLCGALDDSLGIGDVVVATTVNDVPVLQPQSRQPFRSGPVVSVDRVVSSVEEKRLLARRGAIAVDMEAAAVVQRASKLGVPSYCVRAVSDGAGETFLVDLNRARGSDGRFRTSRILVQALRRPLVILPQLVRLRRNAHYAARKLGEFIADCEFK